MSKYQVRRFKQSLHNSYHLPQQQSIVDIYFHKRGHTQIGIKFRNPKPKQYGWKLHDFQCKVARVKNQKGVFLQSWSKYKLSLQQPIKLKVKDRQLLQTDQQQEKQQKMQEDIQQGLSEELCIEQKLRLRKKVIKIYKAVVKMLRDPKYGLNKNEVVQLWCKDRQRCSKISLQDFQLFLLMKNKNKAQGVQFGQIVIERLIHKSGPLYFQTQCIQSSKQNGIIEKTKQWGNVNTSYPKQLQSLMVDSSKNQKKQSKL